MAMIFEGYKSGQTGTIIGTPTAPTTTTKTTTTSPTTVKIGSTVFTKTPSGSISIVSPIVSAPTTPTQTPVVTSIPDWKYGPDYDTNVQPTPIQTPTPEPVIPTKPNVIPILTPQEQFIADITGTSEAQKAAMQQEIQIQQLAATAPTPLSVEGKRDYAIDQLIGLGEIPFGFEGQKPVITSPERSKFLSEYGYKPTDNEYSMIYSDLEANITETKNYITDMESAINQANKTIPQIRSDISKVESAPEDSIWYDPSDPTGEKTITKAEALTLLRSNLAEWESTADLKNDLPTYKKQLNQLLMTQETVKLYEKEGYFVDIGSTGEFNFRLPSAYEAHVGIYGQTKTDWMLGSSQFLASPLGIGTLAQYGATAITGDQSFATSEREHLAEFSLGLAHSLDQGGLEFGKQVITSPAMVEGVYIPALTFGAGYAITGLSAGASGAAKGTSLLGKIGKTTGGKIITAGGKTGMIIMGGTGLVSTGVVIGQTGALSPERLPKILAETGFTFGLAYAGYKGGESAYLQKNTGSWKYNWKTEKMDWTPYEIPKQEVSVGSQNILEFKYPEKNVFYAKGQEISNVNKDVVYDYEAFGGEAFPGGKQPGQQISNIQGFGKISWTEKAPGIRGMLGAKVEHTKFFDLSSRSEPIEGPAGYQGDIRFSKVTGESTLRTGEQTRSEGIAASLDQGKIKPGDYGILKSPLEVEGVGGSKVKIGLPDKTIFAYAGKFKGARSTGTQIDYGNVYSWEFGANKATGPVVSGGRSSGARSFGSSLSQQITKITGETTPITTPKISTGGGSGPGLLSIGVGPVEEEYGRLGIAPGHAVSIGVTQYDIHHLYGSPGKPGGSGWALLSPVASPPEDITGFDIRSRSRSGITTGILSGDIFGQEPESKGGMDTGLLGEWDVGFFTSPILEPGMRQKPGLGERDLFGPMYNVGSIQEPGVRQEQRQQQSQLQDLISLSKYQTISMVTPVTPEPVIPRIPTPKIPRKQPEDDEVTRKTKKQKTTEARLTGKSGKQDIGLYADILSVTRSQARYGKATHPKVTRRLWKIGEKTSFLRVPTLEMIRERSKSKARRRKRKKHVFY